MLSEENRDDPPLDEEDALVVSALTQDDISAIDHAILTNAQDNWRKVAMVVSMSMDAYPDKYLDVPDIFYGRRVRELVLSGKLESQGNLYRMRFSEVRLAPSIPNDA